MPISVLCKGSELIDMRLAKVFLLVSARIGTRTLYFIVRVFAFIKVNTMLASFLFLTAIITICCFVILTSLRTFFGFVSEINFVLDKKES